MTSTARIKVVDGDPALRELIDEWLAEQGYSVVQDRPDLVVVDLPFSRDRGLQLLWSVAQAHAGVPMIALSSTLLSGCESCGAVARQLGVATVLAKPLTREALLAAVGRALTPTTMKAAS